MDERPDRPGVDELRELRQMVDALSWQVREVTARVDRALRDGPAAAARPSPLPAPTPPWPPQPAPAPARPVQPAAAWPTQPAPAWPTQPAPPWPTPPDPAAQDEAPAGSWADTVGMRLLGWVGGGITILGIVLLLVIAAQQGLLGPLARVIIGAVLGLLLLAAGMALHRRPTHQALGVTVVCTGLAVEYLTAVGAVRLAGLVLPIVGYLGCAAIVAVAVALAVAWSEPWLAGVSFAVSGLLAPVVGAGATADVFAFETIMVAGAAACLLRGVGLSAWVGAGSAAAVVALGGMAFDDLTPGGLLAVVVITLITWGTFLSRWVTGQAPVDPGPFPLRQRPSDPEQIARDYADYQAHERLSSHARLDAVTAVTSLALSAGILAVALAVLQPVGERNVMAGVTAVVFAALFAALAVISAHLDALARPAVRVTAWSAAIALAGIALLRLLGGEARSIAWLILAAIALAVVAAERVVPLLWPALGVGVLALIASGPALGPGDLFGWPPARLLGPDGLTTRAFAVVLPASICVILLCAAAWWAISRCTTARHAAAAGDTTGLVTRPTVRRTTVMGWTAVICTAVACYGILGVAMVSSYAITPTRTGYQMGQIATTVLVTVAGLVLLWQGFRRLVLRLGGLALAAVAVAKLLLFDTSSLEAVPRAMTVIGVGILLLFAALVYLRTLARVGGDSVRTP